MKKIIAVIIASITCFLGYSQIPSFSWEYSLSPNFNVQEYKSDTSGNVILVGNVSGTVDFDMGAGVSSWTTPNLPACCPTEDAFIVKYSPSGSLLWRIIFSSTNNETVQALTLDNAGNIYIKASGVSITADLDPGTGTYFLSNPGNFIAKYSPSGALIWVDELDIYSATMNIDPLTNDLLIAGKFYNTIDIDPSAAINQLTGNDPANPTFFMAKFNSNGQLIWANCFANSSTSGNSISAVQVKSDLLGNIFIAGEISGTIDMDPSAGVSNITNSNYIAKYNSLGQLSLLQNYVPTIYTFDFDSNNNIAIGGWFVGLVDFNPGAGTNYLDAGPASSDFFLAKYDNSLNYIWAFTHSNTPNTYSQIQSLNFDNNNNIVLYGNYNLPFSASDFDPGAGIYMVPVGFSNFVAKYSATSDLISFANVEGIVANNVATTYLNKINNKLLLFGYVATSSETIDFDLGAGSTYNQNFGYNEKFLARYDLTCSSSPTYLSDTICYGDTLQIGTQKFYTTGNHPVLLQSSSSGCDSTVVVNLFVRPQVLTNLNIVLCSGQYYFFNGVNINTPGFYQDTLVSFSGCDSLINLTLSVVPVNYSVTQSGNVLSSSETSATGYQWYNCTLNSIIAGAIGINFSVSSTADYAVIISKAGCLDTTNCTNIAVSGTFGNLPTNIWGNQYALNAQFYKVDKSGNSYLVGDFLPQVDLDPSTSVFMPPYDINGIYILKYSSSGAFLWAKWIQTSSGNYVNDVDVDSTGAIYFAGTFDASVDMDAGTGNTTIIPVASSNIFLCKYDSLGNFQWVHSFGTSGDNNPASIAIDKNNNVYMTGYFEDDIDFDAGPGTQVISTAGGNIFNFIVKYNSAGNYISGSGIDSWVQIEKLTIDNSDNIIYSGSFWDNADIDPGVGVFMVNDLSPGTQQNSFIAKLNQSFNFITGNAISSDQLLQIADITTDLNNNILVTGYYRSSVNDFDAGAATPSLPYAGNDDVFIAKYSSAGSFLWAKQVANLNPDYSTTVVSDPNSNTYVLGKYSGTIDADATPGMLMLNCFGASDNYVTTYDSLGNFNWAFRVGSLQDDEPVGMGIDRNGNLYLAGNSTDSVSFMVPSQDVEHRSVLSGVYIAKYGQCQALINTVTNNGAYFSADDIGGNYQWYNCSTNSPIIGATNQLFYPSSSGQYSVLVGTGACAVMSSCQAFLLTSALNQVLDENLVSVFPNPANEKINIITNSKIESISVMDMTGRITMLWKIENSNKQIELNTTQFESGIYIVNIIFENGSKQNRKIVINR